MSAAVSAAARRNPGLAAIAWDRVLGDLDAAGHAVVPRALDADQCAALARLYQEPAAFRSRIVMQRHGFGRGPGHRVEVNGEAGRGFGADIAGPRRLVCAAA
jgi:hypothetical protein